MKLVMKDGQTMLRYGHAPVEFGKIYTYVVDTPGLFTKEKMKAYKRLDAFNY